MPHGIKSQACAPEQAGSVEVEAGDDLGGGAAAEFDGAVDGGGVGGGDECGGFVAQAGGGFWARAACSMARWASMPRVAHFSATARVPLAG